MVAGKLSSSPVVGWNFVAKEQASQAQKQPRLRADAQRNRVKLIEVAADAFAERGADASFEEIARQAGVGIGTRYIGTLATFDDLPHAAVETGLESFAMTNKQEPPNRSAKPDISVTIIMLAAGRSSRMSSEAGHKLLSRFNGVPLVRRMALRAIESQASQVHAITGFRHEEIEACLVGLDMSIAFNPAFASGMASSLIAGLKIPGVMDQDGLLILLADMPSITTINLNQLIEAFAKSKGRSVVRAGFEGTSGNPVILPKALYPRVLTLQGDRGAKTLIEACDLDIIELDIGEAAVADVDTQSDLQRLGGVPNQLR